MPSHYNILQDDRDRQLLDQILRQRGQSLHDFLAAGNAGETLPLGDVGRELVGQKRATLQAEDRAQRYGPSRVEGANPGGPSFRNQPVLNRGMDALLGALRIAELTGGKSDAPGDLPPFGAISGAQQIRARGKFGKVFGELPGGEVLQPASQPQGPQIGGTQGPSDLGRLRDALANNARFVPGVQDPRMGMRQKDLTQSRDTDLGDLRAGTPWALLAPLIEAQQRKRLNPFLPR